MALPDSFDHEKENTHFKFGYIDLISEIGQCGTTSVKTVVTLLSSKWATALRTEFLLVFPHQRSTK